MKKNSSGYSIREVIVIINKYFLMTYIGKIPAIIIAITITGFTKSLSAYLLGDKTQKEKLFSMLNPLVHFEIIGFLCYLFFGCGWGNPIETNSLYFKNRKKASIIINTVPIVVNAMIAVIFGFILSDITAVQNSAVYIVLLFIPIISAETAIINLLPVYPFCGWDILMNILPSDKMMSVSSNKAMFQSIFVLLLFTNILPNVLNKICVFIFGLG